MKLTIFATDKLTHLDRVPVRLWRGLTEDGREVHVFVHRIAVPTTDTETIAAFDRELSEQLPPGRVFPLREVL